MTSLLGLRGSTTLADTLRQRLPSLAAALDESYAAAQIGRLLPRGTTVNAVSAGKAWWRTDGTCTLRYDVRLDAGVAAGGEAEAAEPDRRIVLCRVHSDENAAAGYVDTRVLPLAGGPPPNRSGWRACGVVAAGTGIALHPFPLDPDLPSLRQAMDPLLLPRLLPERLPAGGPAHARVVHHPRQGACVLRYDVAGRDPAAKGQDGQALYGKVYGDESGAVVERWLRALEPDAPEVAHRAGVRFPPAVMYHRGLRLLLMEGLPGAPVVSRPLAGALASGDGSGVTVGAIADAVRRCGCALAALHSHRGVPAPARGADVEMTWLFRELRLVAAVWPGRAERVRRCVPDPPRAGWRRPALCHGDFTPAQVLLSVQTCGLLDLDDLCWADPSLDLGRFLAALDLLAAKRRPSDDGALEHELSTAFLNGYNASAATPGPGVCEPSAPVLFYRRISLARSALHACRQLKDDRFERAVALLESKRGDGSGRASP